MNTSDPPAPNPTSDMTKKQEKAPVNQVGTFKASSMQRVIQVMQTAAQKSCIKAFQLFCLPLDSSVTCCSAQIQPQEETPTPEALRNPPSTIMIVNINNSTLVDCVIGDSNPYAVAERQPLMKGSELPKHAEERCSCCHGPQGEAQSFPPASPHCHAMPPGEQLNINIDSSHLNFVIIGDNNYMHIEQKQPFN